LDALGARAFVLHVTGTPDFGLVSGSFAHSGWEPHVKAVDMTFWEFFGSF